MKKVYILTILAIILVAAGLFYRFSQQYRQTDQQTRPPNQNNFRLSPGNEETADIEVVADNLDIPWEVAFLPNDEYLVTERPGTLVKIGEDRTLIEVSGVRHVGEGGLMGLTLHPNFEDNNQIYLYLTSQEEGEIVNRVERYRLEGNSLSDREVILNGIAGAANHDGGRIDFGPDGYLYITTGDAQNPDLSQNTESLNGKILRINEDGSIPDDNPFDNAVYSYGHRNVQGITWDDQGRLWATEHGRSGIRSGLDELNLIEIGGNYGWPTIQGDEARDGMIKPVIHSGTTTTWAPAGAAYINGSIFFSGLRGQTLYEAQLNNNNVGRLVEQLQGEYGRLRAARVGPNGYLYITTSNTDGRGQPQTGDDKLIRINPEVFN